MTPAGFPHSDIPGSKTVCVSPRLIAAYHVLHRLLVPRHPPCALSSLTGIRSKGASSLCPASQHSIVKDRARRASAAGARVDSYHSHGREDLYRSRSEANGGK